MLRLTVQTVLLRRTTDNSTQRPTPLIHLVLSPGLTIQEELDKEEGATMEAHNQKIQAKLDMKEGARTGALSNLGMTAQTSDLSRKVAYNPMIPVAPSILDLPQMMAKPRSHGTMMAKLSLRCRATEPSSCKVTAQSPHWQRAP